LAVQSDAVKILFIFCISLATTKGMYKATELYWTEMKSLCTRHKIKQNKLHRQFVHLMQCMQSNWS